MSTEVNIEFKFDILINLVFNTKHLAKLLKNFYFTKFIGPIFFNDCNYRHFFQND